MNVIKKLGAGVTLLAASAGSAMAAVPADVTTALGTAKDDVGVIALGVLLVFVAIFGFKVLKRAF